jgi:hypothetical protein
MRALHVGQLALTRNQLSAHCLCIACLHGSSLSSSSGLQCTRQIGHVSSTIAPAAAASINLIVCRESIAVCVAPLPCIGSCKRLSTCRKQGRQQHISGSASVISKHGRHSWA